MRRAVPELEAKEPAEAVCVAFTFRAFVAVTGNLLLLFLNDTALQTARRSLQRHREHQP
jgi:hypothetical protein